MTLEPGKLHKLISKSLDNDHHSRQALYELIAPIVLGVCRRYARNKADSNDIFQESMMNLFYRLHQLRDIEKIEGWAKKIAVNESIRFYKKNRNIIYTENIEVVNHQLISNETVFTQLETKQLLQVIQELPDRMRMVINLFAIEGYKHEEIAEKLGISVGTSKSNLFDARKQIKKRIEKELKNIG